MGYTGTSSSASLQKDNVKTVNTESWALNALEDNFLIKDLTIFPAPGFILEYASEEESEALYFLVNNYDYLYLG